MGGLFTPSFTYTLKKLKIWSSCDLILRCISPEATGVFWISLFGFDNCWKYFVVRPKSNKPSCHRFNRTFWQILFKWKLDFSKEQTWCTPFMSCFENDWSSLCSKSYVCGETGKWKLLLATNLRGGKLVLLASSEMEQGFFNSPTLSTFHSLSFIFFNIKFWQQLQNREVG